MTGTDASRWLPTYSGVVYPWQCDQMGHLNVRFYVEAFDIATWLLVADVGFNHEFLTAHGTGLAALEQRITYHRELLPGQTFSIRSRFTGVADKTFNFVHELTLPDSTLAARAEFVGVHMDRRARAAIALPHDIADRIRSRFDLV